MSRSDVEWLRDARDFARHARDNAGGLSAGQLADAPQPQHAALYDLVVIGEALNRVSPALKGATPDIPWRAIVSLLNVIVHAYWQIDLEIIADVIDKRLDALIEALDEALVLAKRTQP